MPVWMPDDGLGYGTRPSDATTTDAPRAVGPGVWKRTMSRR